MASFLQSDSVTQATGVAQTLAKAYTTVNCTPGSTLISFVFWNDAAATCTVADGTNGSWTAIGSPLTCIGSAFRCQGFFYSGNTSGAKPTVTMTVSGTNKPDMGIAIHEYSGANTVESSNYRNSVGSGGTTGSLTPSLSTDFAFAAILVANAISGVNSPYALRESGTFASNGTADNVSLTGGVATSATFAGSVGDDDGKFIAIFTPAGAPSAPPRGGVLRPLQFRLAPQLPAGTPPATTPGIWLPDWPSRKVRWQLRQPRLKLAQASGALFNQALPPPEQSRRARQSFARLRGHERLQDPPWRQDDPTPNTSPRRPLWRFLRRGKVEDPPWPQVTPPVTAYVPQTLRSRAKAYLLRRGRAWQPPWTGVAVGTPDTRPQATRPRLLAQLRRRGKGWDPPWGQAAVVPPPPYPPQATRPRVRLLALRRGRQAQPTPGQERSPAVISRRIRLGFPRRGRSWAFPPPQLWPLPPARRRTVLVHGYRVRRGKVLTGYFPGTVSPIVDVAGDVTILDLIQAAAAVSDVGGPDVTIVDASGAAVAVVDLTDQQVTISDQIGPDVTIIDLPH